MFGGAKQAIESYLGWWDAAGYDAPVSDQRRDWLAGSTAPAPQQDTALPSPAAAPSTAPLAATPAPVAAAPSASLPATLDAFDSWWANGDDVPGSFAGAPRIPACGPHHARLMLITDCPDAEDASTGQLFAGRAGVLLDAMLGAIGLSRAEVRIGALVPSRPPGGMIDPVLADRMAQVARHHVALVKPKAVLVAGQHAMRTLKIDPATIDQPQFNHAGANVAVRGIHHPRLLIERPLLKRQAWEALKQVRTFL